MKNILTNKEIRNLLLRIKGEEKNPIVVASLISRIFHRSKKTKKVLKAMKFIEDYFEKMRMDAIIGLRIIPVVYYWSNSGRNQVIKIEPCQINEKCLVCKNDICTAEWCINEDHNSGCELEKSFATPEAGWVCSEKCYHEVIDAHPCFNSY